MKSSISNNSDSAGFFSGTSFKADKESSHRYFNCIEEETELQKLGRLYYNDIIFKILVDSIVLNLILIKLMIKLKKIFLELKFKEKLNLIILKLLKPLNLIILF